MATREKTIEFAIPQLNTLADNTLTALTQITLNIPEFSGTVTFKSVYFQCCIQEGATQLTGNYTSRRMDVSVGGAAALSVVNSFLWLGSGENTSPFFEFNFTSHFVSNWTSGTSKTLDVSVLIDGTATTIAWVNVSVTCFITFEYDDSQPTQIKTVYFPLNAPTGALATSKPGTATATIPALDTELPEASKVYRNMHIVVQGNVVATGSTVDSTLSMEIDTLGAYTSQSLEMGATSDYWTRFVYDLTGLGMTTNAAHDFFLWASVARHNHPQAYLVVTYEFDASASSDMFVSLLITANLHSPMGPAAADFQRLLTEISIQETGLTTKQIAFYCFWNAVTGIAGLDMRIGTGSFVSYTDTAAVFCGNNGSMTRNDAAFTLAHGNNILNFDIYRTDTSDLGWDLCGFWIINYTCDKPAAGYGAANHTVKWGVMEMTSDASRDAIIAAASNTITIPETSYFLNNIGFEYKFLSDSTNQMGGEAVLIERLSGETGGVGWLPIAEQLSHTDPETGLRFAYMSDQDLPIFKRYPGDPTPKLLDLETARRIRVCRNTAGDSFGSLIYWITYHSISYVISGTVAGSAGGTVPIYAFSLVSKKMIAETSRSGNGSYSITWYDNTEDVLTVGPEDATHTGAAWKGVAT